MNHKPPMAETPHYPRHLDPTVRTSLQDTPAVLVNGPRQCGKTALARQHASNMSYFSLDDPALLEAVRADRVGFIRQQDRAIIDEIQRAPQLLMALKLAIDQDRRPGRFLLTGSANLMALPQVSDSLAGRLDIHHLLPLSQSELQRRPNDFLLRALAQDWHCRAPAPYRPAIQRPTCSPVLTLKCASAPRPRAAKPRLAPI